MQVRLLPGILFHAPAKLNRPSTVLVKRRVWVRFPPLAFSESVCANVQQLIVDITLRVMVGQYLSVRRDVTRAALHHAERDPYDLAAESLADI